MRRVSVKYLWVIFLNFIRDNFFPILGYFFIRNGEHTWLSNLILVSTIVISFNLVFKFLDFLFFYQWSVTDNKINLNSGVINKKYKSYNIKDVTAVLVTQSTFERVCKLYTVEIDFPQVTEHNKFKIVGLKSEQVQELQHFLKVNRSEINVPIREDILINVNQYKLTPNLIIQSVLISPPITAIISLIFGLFGLLSDIGLDKLNIKLLFTPLDITLYLILVIFIFIGTRVFQYINFKVVRNDTNLEITNGILSVKTNKIPVKHIQNIEVMQNVLERLLGYGNVAVTVLGHSQSNADYSIKKVIPFIKLKDLSIVTNQLLPEFELPDIDVKKNYWPILWLPLLIVLVLLSAFLSIWFLIPTIILLGILLFLNNIVATISNNVIHQGWLIQHHYIYDNQLIEWINYHDVKVINYKYRYLGYRLNTIKRLYIKC